MDTELALGTICLIRSESLMILGSTIERLEDSLSAVCGHEPGLVMTKTTIHIYKKDACEREKKKERER